MEKQTVLRARTPADLLAAVPCILGFQPEQSLVMLTFGNRRGSFHARVDLPDDSDEVPAVVDMLAEAAVSNQVPAVAIVAYTDDDKSAALAIDALTSRLEESGITVVDQLRAHGEEYWPFWPEHRALARPRRFDPLSHPFRAQMVVRGTVVHRSREELARTLQPAPSPAVETAARTALRRRGVQVVAEARWLLDRLLRLAREREDPSPACAGRVLADLLDTELRDVAWGAMERGDRDAWLDIWSHLTRVAPDRLRPAPAALLAFAAWRSGQGALAWCAVDRCREVDPTYSMADGVAQLLQHAVPPSAWPGYGVGFGPGPFQDGLA